MDAPPDMTDDIGTVIGAQGTDAAVNLAQGIDAAEILDRVAATQHEIRADSVVFRCTLRAGL